MKLQYARKQTILLTKYFCAQIARFLLFLTRTFEEKKMKLFAFAAFAACATATAAEWPVSPGTLNWPISGAAIKDATILFGHHDSAGLPKSDWCNKSSRPPMHLGVDIAAKKGDTVVAVDDGVVVRVGNFGTNYGSYVVVESGKTKKWTSLYGHLEESKDKLPVQKGMNVTKGKTIVGHIFDMSVNGDIPHLHLGIRAEKYQEEKNGTSMSTHGTDLCTGSYESFVNPLNYLPSKTFKFLDDNEAIAKSPISGDLSVPFYFGSGYKQQASTVTGGFTYSVSISVSEAGDYNLYAKWPAGLVAATNRDKYVNYKIFSGTKQIGVAKDIDQGDISARGKWVEIYSRQNLMAGNYTITITSHYGTAKKLVTADGILVLKQ